ncbi:hypothetical protein G9C85_04680 [Halorubellus sp. JP-L1]|uniref:DUF7285 family protein n=1 Tax=Halorubellus sp. JP-L1 TaxID=2715753 RepID=UPI00140DE526|nr:hypothetical protein [Halorubellus sp. JP-L1]NHN40931.1 hypothetical protein [Halorubellus sp. JP-L1]
MITLSFSYSPDGTTRGQTEPLAALIAISTIALAIGVYGGFFTDVMDTRTDRDVSEPTLQNVWHTIGEDSVYTEGELAATTLPDSAIPTQYNVYVNVTVLEDSGWEQEEEALYGSSDDASSVTVSDLVGVADFASRSIPYQTDDGRVRSARLNVVVWRK